MPGRYHRLQCENLSVRMMMKTLRSERTPKPMQTPMNWPQEIHHQQQCGTPRHRHRTTGGPRSQSLGNHQQAGPLGSGDQLPGHQMAIQGFIEELNSPNTAARGVDRGGYDM